MIFTKGPFSAIFQTFDCSGEISAKKIWRKCLTILKCGAKIEEKLIFCLKNDKNLVNFHPSTKRSKAFAL